MLDPSAIAIMAASRGLEVRSEEGQGPTPLMCAAMLGDGETALDVAPREGQRLHGALTSGLPKSCRCRSVDLESFSAHLRT